MSYGASQNQNDEMNRPASNSTNVSSGDRANRREPPFLRRLLRSLMVSAPAEATPSVRNGRRAIAVCHALLSERGEVSLARLAAEALATYKSLDNAGLDVFFDGLVDDFSPDRERV